MERSERGLSCRNLRGLCATESSVAFRAGSRRAPSLGADPGGAPTQFSGMPEGTGKWPGAGCPLSHLSLPLVTSSGRWQPSNCSNTTPGSPSCTQLSLFHLCITIYTILQAILCNLTERKVTKGHCSRCKTKHTTTTNCQNRGTHPAWPNGLLQAVSVCLRAAEVCRTPASADARGR